MARDVDEEVAMRGLWRAHRLSAISVLIVSAAISLAGPGLATTASASAGSAASAGGAASAGSGGVRPHPVGELDCNGLSPVQRPVKQGIMCADPHGSDGGRFIDN